MLLETVKANLNLTLPILFTRLLGVGSNVIAMIMIAKLGSVALSASALIMGIFSFCVLLVMAFSFSVCAMVAETCAKMNNHHVSKIIYSSLFLNTLLAIPFMIFFSHVTIVLSWLHQPPQVIAYVGQYFKGLLYGYLPMIWASILEQFFVGIGKPRYILYVSILGLFVMPLLSGLFIFGKFGFPLLGMFGAGFAVSITSIVSLFFLIYVVMLKKWHYMFHDFSNRLSLDFLLVQKLYQLGWPVALQYAGEFFAYILLTVMMGWVGLIALAAQQIILQLTSVVVMIPASVSQATAVLVAKARGQNKPELIKYHTNVSLLVVTAIMLFVAVIYLLMPEQLVQIYLESNNPQYQVILELTKLLLLITALSQCFDGIKNVLTGAYRGLQETKVSMVIGIISLWVVSIPLAYYLGFILSQGAVGVRSGFAIGVMIGAGILVMTWYRRLLNLGARTLGLAV